MLFFVCFVSFFLILVFYLLNFLLSSKSSFFSKISSFESGFVSVGKIQKSFSIHFFIIMLMFVIFDVEIIMLLGFIVSDFNSFVMFFFVFVFILGGLYMEWYFLKLLWNV